MYAGDLFWNVPRRPVDDPHEVAWVEADDLRNLSRFIAGVGPTPNETVTVHYPNPQRVEIEARLEQAGTGDPGRRFLSRLELQIDGQEAALVRVNGMMRGGSRGSGFHRLVQTYEPASFRRELALTGVTLSLALVVGICWRAGREWRRGQRGHSQIMR